MATPVTTTKISAPTVPAITDVRLTAFVAEIDDSVFLVAMGADVDVTKCFVVFTVTNGVHFIPTVSPPVQFWTPIDSECKHCDMLESFAVHVMLLSTTGPGSYLVPKSSSVIFISKIECYYNND